MASWGGAPGCFSEGLEGLHCPLIWCCPAATLAMDLVGPLRILRKAFFSLISIPSGLFLMPIHPLFPNSSPSGPAVLVQLHGQDEPDDGGRLAVERQVVPDGALQGHQR